MSLKNSIIAGLLFGICLGVFASMVDSTLWGVLCGLGGGILFGGIVYLSKRPEALPETETINELEKETAGTA